MTEAAVALAWSLTGGAVLWRCGVRGWPLPTVGFAVGVALHVAWTAVLSTVGLSQAPWALAATALTAVASATSGHRAGLERPRVVATVVAGGGVAAAAAVLWGLRFVQVTPDTWRYLTTTGLLRQGRLEQIEAFTLESRLLTVPAMHTPASESAMYLRSVTPLLAIACVAALVWFVRAGAPRPAPQHLTGLATIAALLLVTNNRFLWNAFYVNGHLALATWFLLLGGSVWLTLLDPDRWGPRLRLLQVAVIPAIVLTRPEAALIAGLVLLPLWAARSVRPADRSPSALALGASTVAWNAALAVAYRSDGASVPTSVAAMLAVGAAVVVVAAVIASRDRWIPARTLGLAEAGLWAVLVVAAALDPGILYRSALATASNVVLRGGWGTSLLVLAVLVAVVLVATPRSAPRTALRFPLTTFIPFGMLLAYLREDPFRVGPGDSLNRMLLHLLPLAVLLVCPGRVTDQTRCGGSTRTDARGHETVRNV